MARTYLLREVNKDGVVIGEVEIDLDRSPHDITPNTLASEFCSVCERGFPRDERGSVLDASGRCDECRP